jgi:hypothetical protein
VCACCRRQVKQETESNRAAQSEVKEGRSETIKAFGDQSVYSLTRALLLEKHTNFFDVHQVRNWSNEEFLGKQAFLFFVFLKRARYVQRFYWTAFLRK